MLVSSLRKLCSSSQALGALRPLLVQVRERRCRNRRQLHKRLCTHEQLLDRSAAKGQTVCCLMIS